jgi:hypothetical protein
VSDVGFGTHVELDEVAHPRCQRDLCAQVLDVQRDLIDLDDRDIEEDVGLRRIVAALDRPRLILHRPGLWRSPRRARLGAVMRRALGARLVARRALGAQLLALVGLVELIGARPRSRILYLSRGHRYSTDDQPAGTWCIARARDPERGAARRRRYGYEPMARATPS